MKISVVVTVKNDPEGEKKLRDALSKQSRKPDEVIIIRSVDYGNCSRARGRNIGIRQAKYDAIAVTDVGCIPRRDWLERLERRIEMVKKDKKDKGDGKSQAIVVAGFYHVVTKTSFQEAVAPYLAVLPHQWSQCYLPASRSIAFTKRAWELVGGYPERAKSGAEDLAFASRLAKHPDVTMIQAPDALVDWEPPSELWAFFQDMVKHTRGNIEVRYWPHLIRNSTVLLRWIIFLLAPWLIPVYLLFWPIAKHARSNEKGPSLQGRSYLGRSFRRFLWLPVVQLMADAAVMYALF